MNGIHISQFFKGVLFGLAVLAILVLAYFLPPLHDRLSWRADVAITYIRSWIQPAGVMPTPDLASEAAVGVPTLTPQPTPSLVPSLAASPTPVPTALVSPTPTLSPTPIPANVVLNPPVGEKQAPNNCGATTLSMLLHFYGWQGDQHTISDLVKPIQADRNVNVEELYYFVNSKVGWLNMEYRVGGDVGVLKRFLAAGLPMMIEESSLVEKQYARYDDDYWDGHYLLITGYDDARQVFITQDSFLGANRAVAYTDLAKNWEPFNHVFIIVFRPEQQQTVQDLLAPDWDASANRQRALDQAQALTQSDPQDKFAWFNLGSNLVYFERYTEAAQAYDSARKLTIPQRMLRYQFGPFIAYFRSNRIQDLLALTQYALKITDNSEEAWLWQGWAEYRLGNKQNAIDDFNKALKFHPGYADALYALNFVQSN
jgi:tetratricopeptide (TPR) repeat protein